MADATTRVADRCFRALFRVGYPMARAWWRVRRPVTHGAFVAVWSRDRLLVIRNSYRRHETVPSGMLKSGESPRVAAARELEEEVGISVAPARLVEVATFALRWEGKHDHAHFFELVCDEEPTIQVDRREVVAGDFLPRAALRGRELVPHVHLYLDHLERAGQEPGSRTR